MKRKVLATVLISAMIAATAVPAMAADTTEPVQVVAVEGTVSESTGNISVTVGTDQWGGYAVSADVFENGQANVKVDGNVSLTAETDGYVYENGVRVGTGQQGKAEVNISGNVSADAGKNGEANGIHINAWDTSEASVSVGGDVSVDSNYGTGATVLVGPEAKASLEVEGNISIDAESYPAGLSLLSEGEETIVVKGDVKATGENSFGIMANAYGDGKTTVKIGGDVKGDYGVALGSGGDSASVNVVIEGTLSGETAPVTLQNLFAPDEYKGDTTLTVWKIVPNADGQIVYFDEDVKEYMEEEDITKAKKDISDFEKNILYIIKVNQPQAGGTVSLDGTVDSNGFAAAKEGDTVTLKAVVQDGYKLAGAYNNGTALTLIDDNGNYYIVVPRGGGVELSVLLEKIAAQGVFTPVAQADDSKEDETANKELVEGTDITAENSDAKIAFYTDGTVEITLPGGEKVSGKFVFVDGKLTFNGIEVEVEIDENGLYHVTYVDENGTSYEFILTAAYIESLKEAVE